MTPNQRALKRYYDAKDPKLITEVPDSTIRRHIEGGRISDVETLALYARLGMPLEGWMNKGAVKRLDKVAPLPAVCLMCEHPIGTACGVCGGSGKQ